MRGLYQFQSRKINFLAAAQETQVGTPLQQTSEAAPGRDFSVRALPRRPRRRAPLGGPRPDSISPRVRAWVGGAIRQLLGGPAKGLGTSPARKQSGPPRGPQPPAAAGVCARSSAVQCRSDPSRAASHPQPPSHEKRGGMPVRARRIRFHCASRLLPPAGAAGAPMSLGQVAKLNGSSAGGIPVRCADRVQSRGLV